MWKRRARSSRRPTRSCRSSAISFAGARFRRARRKSLREVSARLCRLLRDEVVEQMARGNQGLTDLAKDWRKLLFPEANDAQFADGYAQAVTFGLLVARAREISLSTALIMPPRNCARPTR